MSDNTNENQVEDQVAVKDTEETTMPGTESANVKMTEEDILKIFKLKEWEHLK